jgi:hypothetical protein
MIRKCFFKVKINIKYLFQKFFFFKFYLLSLEELEGVTRVYLKRKIFLNVNGYLCKNI